MKNIKRYINISVATASLTMILSGCYNSTSNIEKPKPECANGTFYNKALKECVSQRLKINGVVQFKSCKEDNCTAIISDERGRKIKTKVNPAIKEGDNISIILYSK